jgi:mannose-6-phosphate isomerase
MHRVRGIVQHYGWGDTDALPDLMGHPRDGRPWAEVWFGTHSGGAGSALPVDDTSAMPRPLEAVAGPLPYMVKLLAAATPLSLQTHPSAADAQRGFAEEEAAGIPRGSAERNYVDNRAKPELLIALTPFRALCGVRPLDRTDALLRSIGGPADELADSLIISGVTDTIRALLLGHLPANDIVAACRSLGDAASEEARLVVELEQRHRGDPATVVSLLLNLVTLAPGQALYLTPGNLHAYLHGTAVEVMGSSDNVVRGGLTNKAIDVHELLRLLDPTPLDDPCGAPEKVAGGTWRYRTPGAPFTVDAQNVKGTAVLRARTHELVLCAMGQTDVLIPGQVVHLAPGDTLSMQGNATLFRTAAV